MRRPTASSPWFLGVLAIAVAYWTLNLVVLRAGLPHPMDDVWEDGIVARQLLEGGGFRTHMIYPVVWSLRDPHTLTVPVLVHGPALPLLLAPVLRVFGPGALDHVAWGAALLALLTLLPLFRVAARHFGEPVAAAAAALFTLSPLTVAAVNHYGSVVFGACLLALAIDLLARERARPLLAGLVAGAAHLGRPEMLFAAPVLAVLAGTGVSPARVVAGPPRAGSSLRPALLFLGAFALCSSWWVWLRWQAVGSPFLGLTSYLLIAFSPAHPGDALVRDFGAPPERLPALLAASLPELWRKWVETLPRAILRGLTTPSEATGVLAALGAWWALRQPTLRRPAVLAASLALLPLAAITLLAPVRLYPVPFLPLYAIGAALGARWLADRLPRFVRRPRVWLTALALAALPSTGLELAAQWREGRMIERWLAADRAPLAALARTPENAARPMFSDTPDFVAWTTGRSVIWLAREEFEAIYRGRIATPTGLPPKPRPEDTWFHARDPRDPRDQRGFHVRP